MPEVFGKLLPNKTAYGHTDTLGIIIGLIAIKLGWATHVCCLQRKII